MRGAANAEPRERRSIGGHAGNGTRRHAGERIRTNGTDESRARRMVTTDDVGCGHASRLVPSVRSAGSARRAVRCVGAAGAVAARRRGRACVRVRRPVEHGRVRLACRRRRTVPAIRRRGEGTAGRALLVRRRPRGQGTLGGLRAAAADRHAGRAGADVRARSVARRSGAAGDRQDRGWRHVAGRRLEPGATGRLPALSAGIGDGARGAGRTRPPARVLAARGLLLAPGRERHVRRRIAPRLRPQPGAVRRTLAARPRGAAAAFLRRRTVHEDDLGHGQPHADARHRTRAARSGRRRSAGRLRADVAGRS